MMLIDHIVMRVAHRWMIVRMTVWLRSLVAAMLMLMMRPVRVQMQMIDRFVLMLEIFSALFRPQYSGEPGEYQYRAAKP